MKVTRDSAGHLVAHWMLGWWVGGDYVAARLQLPVAVSMQKGQAVRHPAWPKAADAAPQLRVEQLVVLQLDAIRTIQLNALGEVAVDGFQCGIGDVIQQKRRHFSTFRLLSTSTILFFYLFCDCLIRTQGWTAVSLIEGDLW